ncbi:hypothetical protein ScPMuIL_010504 [Solemya velum]
MFGSFTLSRLRTELRKRGARLSGRKTELIERLEAYDRNKNFGKDDVVGEEFIMDLPGVLSYKDLHSGTDMPNIQIAAIDAYLAGMSKSLDENAKQLYESKFLRCMRMTIRDPLFYFKSECRAEMKKTVSYQIDIAVDCDGCVVECQCECAAGMGPKAHCKHVCAVLYGLHVFAQTGKALTEQTCTQQLQTFHKCKPYTGSPIKAANLGLPNVRSSVRFETRVQPYINHSGYRDFFRNHCINYKTINSKSIAQRYGPANTYAVAHDHDCLELTLDEQWLKDMCITNITNDNIIAIEKATKGQSSNKVWATERCKRLHSSNFGRICKATDRTDFAKLAKSFTEHVKITAAPLIHGKQFEKTAISKFQQDRDVKVSACGIVVSQSHHFWHVHQMVSLMTIL